MLNVCCSVIQRKKTENRRHTAEYSRRNTGRYHSDSVQCCTKCRCHHHQQQQQQQFFTSSETENVISTRKHSKSVNRYVNSPGPLRSKLWSSTKSNIPFQGQSFKKIRENLSVNVSEYFFWYTNQRINQEARPRLSVGGLSKPARCNGVCRGT